MRDPDPNHEVFQRVRRGLGLDFLAIDYSYDRQGKPVIWEINVLPGLGLPRGPEREYLHPHCRAIDGCDGKDVVASCRLGDSPEGR